MNETTKMEQGRDPGETLEEAETLFRRWREDTFSAIFAVFFLLAWLNLVPFGSDP